MLLAKAKTYSYTSPSRCLDRITKESLRMVELHLDNHEKVSLVFLFDIEVNEAIVIILNNIIKRTSENGVLCDLYELALQYKVENFEERLIEALRLIQNEKVVKLLDFHGEHEQNFINPVRRGLFQLCEDLHVAMVHKLMELVKEDFAINNSYLYFYSDIFMEFNLLCLLMCKYISDGTDGPCDFENLVQVLKKMGLVQLAQMVDDLEKEWNEQNEESTFLSESEEINDLDGTNGNSQCMEKSKEDSTDVNGADRKVALPYSINPSSMGLCVIINQEIFSQTSKKTDLDNRYGTNIDRDMLKITFASFGYDVIVHQDLNSALFMKTLYHTIKNKIRRDHSSFILCILSHGKKDEVYCTDGVSFPIEGIEKLMLGQTCQRLLGKPKVLIVQACQGQDTLQAMEVEEDLVMDGGGSRVRRISPVADLTTFISSFPGYASVRSYRTGSWFIQTLCKQLLQQGHSSHLHDVFISVTDELNRKCFAANSIVTPLYKSTNTKKLLLPYIPERRSVAAQKLLERALFEKVYNEYLFTKVARHFYKDRLKMTK